MTPLRSMSGLGRQVLIEARRSGLALLAIAAVCAALLIAGFLSHVALVEAKQLQAAMVAALLRGCAVFLVAGHVAASTVREYNDKGLELHLSLPISRALYYLGRLAGHAGVGVGIAVLFALPLLFWVPAQSVLLWAVSLCFENLLVACAALFFAITFVQVLAALSAVAGLYVLGRSIAGIQALATGPLVEDGAAQRVAGWLTDGLSFLLPRLDLATRTDWLLYGVPDLRSYLLALAGLAAYALLLAAAGMFDLYRRNL